jgi:chaperonin cofactor prefoldin
MNNNSSITNLQCDTHHSDEFVLLDSSQIVGTGGGHTPQLPSIVEELTLRCRHLEERVATMLLDRTDMQQQITDIRAELAELRKAREAERHLLINQHSPPGDGELQQQINKLRVQIADLRSVQNQWQARSCSTTNVRAPQHTSMSGTLSSSNRPTIGSDNWISQMINRGEMPLTHNSGRTLQLMQQPFVSSNVPTNLQRSFSTLFGGAPVAQKMSPDAGNS